MIFLGKTGSTSPLFLKLPPGFPLIFRDLVQPDCLTCLSKKILLGVKILSFRRFGSIIKRLFYILLLGLEGAVLRCAHESLHEHDGVVRSTLDRAELAHFGRTLGLWFGKPGHIVWPLDSLELGIVKEVEVVKFLVVEFGVEDIPNQLIDILDFSKHELLEHPEPLCAVEYLEGCEPPQHLQRLVLAVVDSVIRVFVEGIQDGHHYILAEVFIHLLSE